METDRDKHDDLVDYVLELCIDLVRPRRIMKAFYSRVSTLSRNMSLCDNVSIYKSIAKRIDSEK